MEKIIHQIWLHGTPPNKEWRNRWRQLHPTWKYQLWSAADLDWLHNKQLYADAQKLVCESCVDPFKSDIARYEILLRYGGFYCDCDTEPLKAIDESLIGHTLWGVEYGGYVSNTYLACISGHEAMYNIVHNLDIHVRTKKKPVSVSSLTGMRYITQYWTGHVEERDNWFPYTHYESRNPRFVPTIGPNTIAIHHWASQQTEYKPPSVLDNKQRSEEEALVIYHKYCEPCHNFELSLVIGGQCSRCPCRINNKGLLHHIMQPNTNCPEGLW